MAELVPGSLGWMCFRRPLNFAILAGWVTMSAWGDFGTLFCGRRFACRVHGGRERQPPDLEEFFRRIRGRMLSFGARRGGGPPARRCLVLILVLCSAIWAGSGFYTVGEAERGVVLRFGRFDRLVQPGLNWRPIFVDTVTVVNVESVRELATSGVMLTSDENVVRVEMNVQYRLVDPRSYLFSVPDADDSLRQATDSALRGVIGRYTMDRILTEGRTLVRSDTRTVLEEIIRPYEMGIALLDVNFQAARPPEEVKAAFDDAIAARENEQQYIREAEAYANEIQPRANGQARRILEEGRAYGVRTVLEAQADVQRFVRILSEYRSAPEVVRERLYMGAMENVLRGVGKVLVCQKDLGSPIKLVLRGSILEGEEVRSDRGSRPGGDGGRGEVGPGDESCGEKLGCCTQSEEEL